MGKYLWAMLLAGVLVVPLSWAQESEPKHEGPHSDMFHEIKMRHKQLDIEEREAELEFRREMHRLEVEKGELELERGRQALKQRGHDKVAHRKAGKGIFLICGIVNLLLAIWVYQDIRKRNAGSGIWIVVTLLAGFFGALIYAIVRLGDKKE